VLAVSRALETRPIHGCQTRRVEKSRRNKKNEWRSSSADRILTWPPLEPEELEMIRLQIESGFDDISAIDPEIRGIVERNWPHLIAKLPPETDD
jgi:hypothetical protein